jgi:uncharacterized protein YggE
VSARSVLAALAAVAAVCLCPALASAQGRTITAIGTGVVEVRPADRDSNASIGAAIERAEEAAVPRAITDSREYGELIARTLGVTLGAVLSVDQNVQTGPIFYPPGLTTGSFGPGQFCGRVSRFVRRRDASGRLRRVRRGSRRTCRFPARVQVSLAVTYAVS